MFHILKQRIEINTKLAKDSPYYHKVTMEKFIADINCSSTDSSQSERSNQCKKAVVTEDLGLGKISPQNKSFEILKEKLSFFVSKNSCHLEVQKFIETANKSLSFSLNYLCTNDIKASQSKKITLQEPKGSKKKLLILDLDETLIHSVSEGESFDVEIAVEGRYPILMNIRPGCQEFLEKISQYYTIYVFTASTLQYAQPIIDHLNKKKTLIHGILSRKNCFWTKNGHFIKDLRIISNRGLEDIVIVDNLIHSFSLQLDNGIPILEFIDDKKDNELKHILSILIKAKDFDDVRVYLSQSFGLRKAAQFISKQNFSS